MPVSSGINVTLRKRGPGARPQWCVHRRRKSKAIHRSAVLPVLSVQGAHGYIPIMSDVVGWLCNFNTVMSTFRSLGPLLGRPI